MSFPNTNSTYHWEIFQWDMLTTAITSFCESTSNQPNIFITTFLPTLGHPNGYTFFARITVTTPNCSEVQLVKGFNIPMLDCQGVIVFGAKSGDDIAVNALKQLKSTSSEPKVFPNPVSDILRITNLNDAEDYTFDIQNTLGQTVLSQKVSSIETSIDVSNLITGVYIGVIKSQGKIISTAKVYKK
jgi:Secretion system C-terminal sorting domain